MVVQQQACKRKTLQTKA